MSSFITRTAFRTLTKKHGLGIKSDALKLLVENLSGMTPTEISSTLEYIAQSLLKLQVKSGLIDARQLQQVLNLIFKKVEVLDKLDTDKENKTPVISDILDGEIKIEEGVDSIVDKTIIHKAVNYIQVINSFDLPNIVWRPDSRSFAEDKTHTGVLCNSTLKAHAFRERYNILVQRLLRSESFQKKPFITKSDNNYEITPIKQLYGKSSNETFLLFGMLTQISEGHIHLEDPDELIELIISKDVARGIGLFTFNSFVLVEGYYCENRTFCVTSMASPVSEERDVTLSAYGHSCNFFGDKKDIMSTKELLSLERALVDTSIVVLSEVHLDDPDVILGLKEMFAGFTKEGVICPSAFIFCGNFISGSYLYNSSISNASGYNYSSLDIYKNAFDTFTDMISEFPIFSKRNEDAPAMIFVPGPSDPWCGNILPSAHIPETITERLVKKIAKVSFTNNPCRIKCFTQEFVIFRSDSLNKMLRNSLLRPLEDNKDVTEIYKKNSNNNEEENNVKIPIEVHLSTSIIDQAHLSPLPAGIQPIYWSYDNALRLYPPPHNLIMADQCLPYSHSYKGTNVCNPSTFKSRTGFNFMIYYPSSKKWERSEIKL